MIKPVPIDSVAAKIAEILYTTKAEHQGGNDILYLTDDMWDPWLSTAIYVLPTNMNAKQTHTGKTD